VPHPVGAAARLFSCAVLFSCLWPCLALAQTPPPPAERLHVYSPYEEETIEEVLEKQDLSRDPSPEGKTVERIDIVPLDVFERRDALPTWLNVFHVTSRKSVIRREVLLREGQRYEQALVDDTIRNLRRFPGVPQLSLVLVVAAKGSSADRVVVVVITKDVWSLRLNWNVLADAGGIDQLSLQPAETNFLGTHQILGANFILEPAAYTLGLDYMVPRLEGTRIALQSNANIMVNRDSGSPEGTYGGLVAGEPLFAGNTEWAWDSNVQWQDVIYRAYSNAQVRNYVDPRAGCSATDATCVVPFQFHQRVYQAQYELTRSFGWTTNHDFTLATNMGRAAYQTSFSGANPRTVADFTSQVVPLGDTRAGPSLQYHTYEWKFVRVVDFDTLALQEDYRLGHDVVLRVYPAFKALGSSRDVVALYGAAQYTWAIRDGLFRIIVESDTEPEPSRVADAYVQPTAHLVTPTIAGAGRIVLDGTWLYRWRDYLNVTEFLGNGDRLRGYPTNFLVGQNLMAYNVEFRTRPIEIFSMELGAVAFYDAGDAYGGVERFQPYQSVGAGLRGLFPWLDRTVFQLDFGFPIERPINPATGAPIAPYNFVLSFGQAFSTPTISALRPVLPTGQGPDSP
jgi:hypothetical protein